MKTSFTLTIFFTKSICLDLVLAVAFCIFCLHCMHHCATIFRAIPSLCTHTVVLRQSYDEPLLLPLFNETFYIKNVFNNAFYLFFDIFNIDRHTNSKNHFFFQICQSQSQQNRHIQQNNKSLHEYCWSKYGKCAQN